MGQVIVLEGHIPVQDHLGGLESDGAVGAVHNGLRGAQDGVQIGLAALTVQQLVQQGGQPVQADAAGHTFAAALGQAEFQKGAGELYGTVSAGGRRDAALHVGVEIVHCALGILPWGDTQSAQNQWSPFLWVG